MTADDSSQPDARDASLHPCILKPTGGKYIYIYLSLSYRSIHPSIHLYLAVSLYRYTSIRRPLSFAALVAALLPSLPRALTLFLYTLFTTFGLIVRVNPSSSKVSDRLSLFHSACGGPASIAPSLQERLPRHQRLVGRTPDHKHGVRLPCLELYELGLGFRVHPRSVRGKAASSL